MSSEGNITVIESFSADDTHALGVTLGQQAKPRMCAHLWVT